MDLTMIKQKISNYNWSKKLAEPLLNMYVHARYCAKRQYTADGADKTALIILEKHFGIKGSQIQYYDIGANHYLRGSNTYLCYRQGGRGVLVEADPILCQSLQKKRRRDQILATAIIDHHDDPSRGGDTLSFYVCSLPTRSTLDASQAEELVRMGFKIERTIQIPSMTFEEIVQKTGIIPDLLSIDVEGYDFRVLKSIDFVKYPVKVIVAEYDGKHGQDEEDMADYMEKQGYQLYKRYHANGLFVRNI